MHLTKVAKYFQRPLAVADVTWQMQIAGSSVTPADRF